MRSSAASSINNQDQRRYNRPVPVSLLESKENGRPDHFSDAHLISMTRSSSTARNNIPNHLGECMPAGGRKKLNYITYFFSREGRAQYSRLPSILRSSSLKVVIIWLLLITGILTVTFPIAPFESSEHDHFLTTAQQRWNASSRRAKEVMLRWESFQKKESRIKEERPKVQKTSSGDNGYFPYWEGLTTLIESLGIDHPSGQMRLGLLNFEKEESDAEMWVALTGGLEPLVFELEPANKSLIWKDLYPEWIDEEEVYEVPKCPSLPMPSLQQIRTPLDVILAKLPCVKAPDWARNVSRLHLQLATASVATQTNASHVLLMSECPPLPNLFTCRELVSRSGDLWLYAVNHPNLRKKLSLPVGSCELAVPLKTSSQRPTHNQNKARKEAYATILHSADMYVCGAIALAQSIRKTGSRRDMVILVDDNITPYNRQGLELAGWILIEINRIRNPKADPETYNEWNYSKLRLWHLTNYKKVIFLDADILVLRNIDFLFDEEEISASGNSRFVFNSGVMVIEPSKCTFEYLMSQIEVIFSYNGGDQGFLNEIFTWWHRLPRRMNYLKHFYNVSSQEELEEKTRLFAATQPPEQLYVLHFLGYKPWLCFRDYDCSWHIPELRNFASDVAHATWWRIHDTMPVPLQQFCLLSENQTATIAAEMEAAHLAPLPVPELILHLQNNISDPRFHYPTEPISSG